MEEVEESRSDFMQRLQSTATSSASMSIPKPSRLDLPSFNAPQVRGQFRHFPQSPESTKRIGIPPAHPHFSPSPYPQIPPSGCGGGGGAASRPPSSAAHNFIPVPSHSRSLSQPAFLSLDSLPQFSTPSPPLSDPSSADLAMEDLGASAAAVSSQCPTSPAPPARTGPGCGSGRATGDGLPPRKSHRRSQSDIPFGFMQSCPSAALPPLPHQSSGFLSHLVSPREGFGSVKNSNQLFKQETEWEREAESSGDRKSEGDAAGDDLFNAYMNLESLDTLNSSGTEEKREDSRASGTKNGADSSENEAESSVYESGSSLQLRKEGNKRSAAGDPVPISLTASRHNRSLSMDSFMGKLHFADEPSKLPPPLGQQVGQLSRSGSMDGVANSFSLEFGSGEFSGAELKKIMANDKLAEIAMADPRRAKRILANRQSAARSKERKMRYISELEHKVQTLQSEATTLSAQLTLFQRDSSGLTSQNNELKFRLQAMEQQAQLRDALNEALTSEVQRLRLATGEAQLVNSLNQQMQLNPQMFPLQQQLQKQQQQQHCSQMPHYSMQSQQQQQQQQQNDSTKVDSNK